MGKLKSYLKRKLVLMIRNQLKLAQQENNLAGNIALHPSANVTGSLLHGTLKIAEGVEIHDCTIAGNNISIGRYTSVSGPNTTIYSEVHSVSIGNFCSIARNVDIQEWNHPVKKLSTFMVQSRFFGGNNREEMESKGPIVIGHDVWIGTQAIILSGAKIGNGAIIGANAVVSGEIPAFAVAAGNPAKIVRYRFDEATIAKINELQWWDWSVEKIKENKELFQSNYFS
jgi:virginiamycin A acetyltransferase